MKKRPERDHWTVLIAEDTDDHALLIQTALERASRIPVEVYRTRDGDEALVMLEDIVPDLLLLDLKMPGRSGHEVLDAIKGDDEFRRIPVAVLTSSDLDEDVARSYGLGGNHFITKPENQAGLERQLTSLLNNLHDLAGIGRGSGGLEATAVSAVDPGAVALRQFFMWAGVVLVIVFLLVFARTVEFF
jgi:CheY-like chemotaxis protein